MNSKAFIFLGLLFALILLVSSDVAAETSKDKKKLDASEQTNQVGDVECGHYGCCRWGSYGRCERCCHYAGEYENLNAAKEANPVDNAKYGGGGWGGHGGGGGWGGHGGGGGGWGGHGGHGGGGGGGWGGRCCGGRKAGAGEKGSGSEASEIGETKP